MAYDEEKLDYLIKFTRNSIYEYIVEVLEDEEKELSAVTLNNTIICYLDFVNAVKDSEPSSVYDFFLALGFENEDYQIFEKKRKAESEYYIGKQF